MRAIVAIVAALLFCGTATAGQFMQHRAHLSTAGKVAYFQRSVHHEQQVVRFLEGRHAPRTLERVSELRWYRAALRWHRQLLAQYEAKLSDLPAWLCIHRLEGAWNTDTGNGYYGGLQMNLGFQRTYGPELVRAKGTADHWTPAEQIMVARRARAARGYRPWPNTARACGLLP